MQISKDLESDMSRLGVFVKDPEAFLKPERRVGVYVELGVPRAANIDLPEMVIETVSKRGVSTVFDHFTSEERGDLNIISFQVMQQVPDTIPVPACTGEMYGTSFLDLCWFIGNEAIDTRYESTTLTPLAEEAISTDLGYYLPARFLDSFIEAMGKINDIFFSGALEDAMVYGVLSTDKVKTYDLTLGESK